MPILRGSALTLFCSALFLTASGCSISRSSESISDSIGSISDSLGSLSESSSPKEDIGKEKVSYRDDIATLTHSISGTSLSAEEFPVALARTARQHGITNWAQEKATFYGIGKGLKKAGIAKENIQSQAFLRNVLTANPEALNWIEKGYSH